MLQVFQLSTLAELDSLRLRWNELSGGVPTRSWEWYEGWWRIYGDHHEHDRNPKRHTRDQELYILAVFEPPDKLIGIAPWYIEHSPTQGRILRFLGNGEVCTDYSTLLCEPGQERYIAEAICRTLCDPLHLADWLTDSDVRHWDRIEFESVATNDVAVQHLIRELEQQDNLVHRRPAENCWRLQLPATWEEYLAQLSKSHRKQVRRCQRELFDTGRAVMHTVTSVEQLDDAWERLVRLHQERWNCVGKPGCFASPQFFDFHREFAERMLDAGALRLQWLEFDGREIAAEYHLLGKDTVYAYQGGFDPAAGDVGPGRLSLMACLRQAIDEGRHTFDFMRGDETYKPHWRAEPITTEDVRIVKRTTSNRLRQRIWQARDQVKHWFKKAGGQK